MQRLGGGFIPLQGIQFSSVVKGETLADTVRVFGSYSDVIVIRHPEVGSAKIAAEFCDKPVINAGDGVGEHPTQALLDIIHHNEPFYGRRAYDNYGWRHDERSHGAFAVQASIAL